MMTLGSTIFCIILLMIIMFAIVNLMFRNFHRQIQDLDEDLRWNIATFLLISEIIVDTAISGLGLWMFYIFIKNNINIL